MSAKHFVDWVRLKTSDQRTLPLDRVIHNDLPVYMEAEYGGRHIEQWPFFRFIRVYLAGREQECIFDWTEWLVREFAKYGLRRKSHGGMLRGSVHLNAARASTIETNYALRRPDVLSEADIRIGAEMLVRSRIQLVSSIAQVGYQPSLGVAVFGIKDNDCFVLKGGHHRAATLWALGYKEMPGIHVVSRNGWRYRQCWTRAREILSFPANEITRPG